MTFKIIVTIIILIICVILYFFYQDKEHSLTMLIISSLITTIICNLVIPSDISIFDNFSSKTETATVKHKDDLSLENGESENTEESIIEETGLTDEAVEEKKITNTEKSIEEKTDILPIELISRNVSDIEDNLLDVAPTELSYYEGNITYDNQIDTYEFIPLLNGRYRFEVADMLSGVKINIAILNQAGEQVESTYYGVEKDAGITIDNMTANEKYVIQIKQYFSYSPYKILIGLQKATVPINNGITQISDSIQYTEQKNSYEFMPPLDGQYRFELGEMPSGSKINMAVYNPGGERVDSTTYGISNGEGLTIDGMSAGEMYNISITQYENKMDYKLYVGYQKETVVLNGETEISDSIQYTAQKNQYQFIPPINGRYRFEISDIVSGVDVNMKILNQAGGTVDGTTYGIKKNEGITIDDMVAGEVYTIQIIQHNSYSSYKLEIGYQKESVEINLDVLSDTMQYTRQRNIYLFRPETTSDYSFIVENMVSGMKVNIAIYNEGGECINGSSYGIENGNGLTIENMVKDELYTIYVTQYEGEGTYFLRINKL